MAQFETWLKSDLKKPVEVVKLKGNLFSADNGGNLIGVEVLDDGSPATLSGEVHGYAIREDNYTVIIEGTLANNKASIVLPLACYNVVGQISIVIKVGETTVGACTGYVYRSTTDAVVDPAHVIPSIEELLAQIDACIEATDDANEAAEKIDNMTVAATGLAYDANPTATISEVSGHKHIAFGIPGGTPATIKTQTDYYQNSSSGTVIPSGEWSTTQPTTPQGSFLWVKHHVVWYDDTETDVYSVSRQGVDGNGSVSSILLGSNQLSPDASGQITLPIDNAPTANSENLVLSGALQSQFSALNNKATVNAIQKNSIDLDTLVIPGVYACNHCTHTPGNVDGWFNVEVLPNGGGGDGSAGYAIQVATPLSSATTYKRACNNGTWTAWQELALKSDITTTISYLDSNNHTRVSRSGNVVTLTFWWTTSTELSAITLDSAIRPKFTEYVSVFRLVGSTYTPTLMSVSDAGKIGLMNSTGGAPSDYSNVFGMITYVCNG